MNHLKNALRKTSHQYGRNWGGYLLPQEVLAIRDLGVRIDKHYVDWAIDCKRAGRIYGRWTYWDANDKFEEVKREYDKNRGG